ncbi:aldo/keto reductase [bacterium]|nr:aldo/keto reductase [bacterium]
MRKRRLGRTELMVSEVGIGGLGIISNILPDRQAGVDTVRYALDRGMNYIDTARGYFDAESVIGLAIEGRRDEVILSSKSYLRSGALAYRDLETSLATLKVKKLDMFQVHHVQYKSELEQVMAPKGALEALETAKREGLIDHIGITSHHTRVLAEALETGRFDTVMFPFSPVEHEGFEEIYRAAKRFDVGIIAMKVLSSGRLTAVEEAIQFCLAHDIAMCVLGCTTREHVDRDIAAAEAFHELTEEQKRNLCSQGAGLAEGFCRRCRICEGLCPMKIPIADVFRCEDYLILNATYARNEYRALERRADDCLGCGQCEMVCPFKLPVRQGLQRAHERLNRGKFEDMAVNFLHKVKLYDLARKAYFSLGGKLPER